ncbi:MAG: Uma2 family endonuclease [Pyrinomonadaceae bacterium]|nr:Uma2 family endonuclease [Pyrinomonadaceae bacterium]
MPNLQEISMSPRLPPPFSAEKSEQESLRELIEKLPPDSHLTVHEQTWKDYENLLEAVGEASGLRISYDGGTLQIMTLSAEHESYAQTVIRLISLLSVFRRIEIGFFGSATIKKSRLEKGTEPDACFYIQTAAQIGNRINLDFSVDPAPDVAVEIDLHHESLYKFPIYAALGVSEIWRYDGRKLEIHHLENGKYITEERSAALPVLTAELLTDFLNRSRTETQSKILFAFEDWLKTQK